MVADGPPLPFDCKTCKQQIERNCGNRFKLIDSCVDTSKNEKGTAPLWQQKDLKDKLPGIRKGFPEPVFEIGDFVLYECPLTWTTTDTRTIIKYLTIQKEPPKLFPGSWSQQPRWWIQAIQIYHAEQAGRKPPIQGD